MRYESVLGFVGFCHLNLTVDSYYFSVSCFLYQTFWGAWQHCGCDCAYFSDSNVSRTDMWYKCSLLKRSLAICMLSCRVHWIKNCRSHCLKSKALAQIWLSRRLVLNHIFCLFLIELTDDIDAFFKLVCYSSVVNKHPPSKEWNDAVR